MMVWQVLYGNGAKRLSGEVRATISHLERIIEFEPFSDGFKGGEWFNVKG